MCSWNLQRVGKEERRWVWVLLLYGGGDEPVASRSHSLISTDYQQNQPTTTNNQLSTVLVQRQKYKYNISISITTTQPYVGACHASIIHHP